MANTLRFKRGLASGLPTGAAGEPLFTTDTFDLYIGNGTGNTRFQKYIASGATTQILRGDGSLYTFPLAISSPTNGQVLKYNGTSWVNDSDAGITGSLTTNYLPKATGASTIGNSLVFDNGTSVGIGTATPQYRLTVQAANLTMIGLVDSAEATDQRSWAFQYGTSVGAGTFRLRAVNDAFTNGQNAYIITRTGIAVDTHQWLTAGSERARIFATGNFGINTGATDSGQRLQVVGTSSISGQADFGNAVLVAGALGSHQTSKGVLEYNGNKVAIRAYGATAGTGFIAFNTGGGGGSADTERVRIMENGSVLVGITGITNVDLMVRRNLTSTSATAYSVYSNSTFQSDVTNASVFASSVGTQATAFTLTSLYHFNASNVTVGAGSAVTNQYGFIAAAALTSATNNYGFYGDLSAATGRWNLYMNGTALNYMNGALLLGSTSSTGEQLQVTGTARISGAATIGGRLDVGTTPSFAWSSYLEVRDSLRVWDSSSSSYGLRIGFTSNIPYLQGYRETVGTTNLILQPNGGNLGIGVSPSAWGQFRVIDIGTTGAISNYTLGTGVQLNSNMYWSGSGWIYKTTAAASRIMLDANVISFWNAPSGTAGTTMTLTQAMTLDASGNLLVGSATSSGERLQVTGTAKITGAVSFGTTVTFNGSTVYNSGAVIRADNGTAAAPSISFDSDLNTGLYRISNDVLGFSTAGAERMRLDASGNLTVDTNVLFVDATNNRVGILTTSPSYGLHVNGTGYFNDNVRFPNLKGVVFVQTGGSLLGSISMDSSNAITIDNNGFFGLSVGTNYNLLGGNTGIGTNTFGTSATRTFAMLNGTAPSTSPTDTFQMYSNDVTAGNAAPHFRTENGAVIKLYQETTSVGNAIMSVGGGSAVLDDTTFDGYTLRQVVKALRNQGILA